MTEKQVEPNQEVKKPELKLNAIVTALVDAVDEDKTRPERKSS